MEKLNTKKSKEKLLYSCANLMLLKGYHAVSVDSICEKAQVLKGSFYHYFKSKTDLTLQAMEYHFQESGMLYERILSSNKCPNDKFKGFFQHIYKTQNKLYESHGHVCGSLTVTLGSEMACNDEISSKAAAITNNHIKYYERALEALASSDYISKKMNFSDTAYLVNAYVVGKITQARISNNLMPLEKLESEIHNLIHYRSDNPY